MLLLLSALLAADPVTWKTEEVKNGVLLQSRELPGSKFYEFRAQTRVDVAPEILCDRIYAWLKGAKVSPELKLRTVIEDRGDSLIVNDRLEAPIVSPRMVTFEIQKKKPALGSCSIESDVRNDKAPPTPDGCVRMDKMKSSWKFEPTAQGTRTTFTLYSEPGGSVPAFIVHGAQRDATRDTLLRALEHLKQKAAR